jgi:hypothetical protein
MTDKDRSKKLISIGTRDLFSDQPRHVDDGSRPVRLRKAEYKDFTKTDQVLSAAGTRSTRRDTENAPVLPLPPPIEAFVKKGGKNEKREQVGLGAAALSALVRLACWRLVLGRAGRIARGFSPAASGSERVGRAAPGAPRRAGGRAGDKQQRARHLGRAAAGGGGHAGQRGAGATTRPPRGTWRAAAAGEGRRGRAARKGGARRGGGRAARAGARNRGERRRLSAAAPAGRARLRWAREPRRAGDLCVGRAAGHVHVVLRWGTRCGAEPRLSPCAERVCGGGVAWEMRQPQCSDLTC